MTHPAAPSLRRVLIANRAEIALRIIRACREANIESVAVYSDADRTARHVRAADQALHIGPAAAAESYLASDRIVEAALRCGADAVHPGYGFLSERADFAAACEAAGLVFIGPSPETLARLGDKLAARRAAVSAGVPIVPGTFDPLGTDTPEAMAGVAAAAEQIGWPLLVKAAAGGGGRGMRRVDDPEGLAAAVSTATREAAAAFGDGAVYLERLVEGGRHVEVQLLGDDEGTVVALGERDCSVQRRHQKLVEEAPAPGLSIEQRRMVHMLAVRMATTVGLRNAATAEFLLTPDGDFYFLEVNARLQVEHGVTELVTGLDLVREQLAIAAGSPLSLAVLAAAALAASPTRHSIEVRISAEHPLNDFAPAPGTIARWREAGGPGIRVDAGVEEGTVVTPEYDPLLAKLLVVAPDREAAIARLRRALSEFEIGGIQTTVPFHLWLVDQADFVAGDLRTDLVALSWDPEPLWRAAAGRAAEAVARTAAHEALAPGGERKEASPARRTESTAAWHEAARQEAVDRWS